MNLYFLRLQMLIKLNISMLNYPQVFEISTANYELCSMLLGLGVLLTYVGVLRYLGFFQSYNVRAEQYILKPLFTHTYLGLLQLEHRPSTIPLQHTRFWAASHAPFQLSFWALSSASVSRLQLLQGRPLLRFPWGFQLRACRVMLAGGFLSVWPLFTHIENKFI